MQDTDIPAKFNLVWGKDAGTSYIRAIPDTTTDENAASLDRGFPPATFAPLASGGAPPDGRDMNGILNRLVAWQQWAQAGAPITYDSTFQTAIGGYPKGAIVASATTFGIWWLSTADNNTTNPDNGGAGWTRLDVVGSGSSGALKIANSGVTAGTYDYPNTFTVGADGRLSAIGGNGASVGGSLSGSLPNPSLAATGVTAGTYAYPRSLVVGSDGRISSVGSQGPVSTMIGNTASGSFNIPAGVTTINGFAWGGGGGGGGSANANSGGGGGGGSPKGWFQFSATQGDSISYSVGAGGSGGNNSPTAGGTGGGTTIYKNGNAIVYISGGTGGGFGNGGIAGATGGAGSASGTQFAEPASSGGLSANLGTSVIIGGIGGAPGGGSLTSYVIGSSAQGGLAGSSFGAGGGAGLLGGWGGNGGPGAVFFWYGWG